MTCPPNVGPDVMLKFCWTKGVGNGQETLHTRAALPLIRLTYSFRLPGFFSLIAISRISVAEHCEVPARRGKRISYVLFFLL